MHILVYGMVGNHRGGIETFLLKMNSFMSADTIFDYVIEETECFHEDVIKKRGGNVYRVPSRSSDPLGNIRENKKLLKNLRNHLDIVYFNLSSLSWIEPIRIARALGYKIYIHSHNAQFIKNNGSIPYRIINSINKRRLSSYKGIKRLTCSQPATNFMFMKKDKVEMIYNAVYVNEFFFDEIIRKEKRQELCVDDSEILIGFVGRLQDQKNPLYLLKIMKAAHKYCSNIKMIIVGDGDMRCVLEEQIKEQGLSSSVKILGNRTDVNKLMQAMDIFVLPSNHEGLPFAVVEAQAGGLRCIVSKAVTTEVDYTGNVIFLELEDDAENWGKTIEYVRLNKIENRTEISGRVERSNFNIVNEAKRLEKILLY